MRWKFIENHTGCLQAEIDALFKKALQASFAIAFIRASGVNLIADALGGAVRRGVRVRVLFGTDWALTEASAVRRLQELGAEVKSYSGRETFHPKGYIFQQQGQTTTAIVGSANLSASGLTFGREWSVLVDCDEHCPFIDEFERLWNSPYAQCVTDTVLLQLERKHPPPDLAELSRKEDQGRPLVPTVGIAQAAFSTISFSFNVNRSFRDKSNHPITVPSSQVSYDQLRSQRLDRGELRVVFENAPPLTGNMYSGTAGYGPYYQIMVRGRGSHRLFVLPVGTPLRVQLEKSGGVVCATLVRVRES